MSDTLLLSSCKETHHKINQSIIASYSWSTIFHVSETTSDFDNLTSSDAYVKCKEHKEIWKKVKKKKKKEEDK